MKVLILVGLQNDLLPGGSLPTPDGNVLLSHVNELLEHFRLAVATQQWHPANHRSFFNNHRGRVTGDRVKVAQMEQVLKPTHCVQNTYGAELSSAIRMPRINKIVRLGIDADLDDDSGFFDVRRMRPTGLSDFLQEKKVHMVYVAGLTTDQAVLATALDSLGLGYKTWVISDACRPSDGRTETTENALARLADSGVTTITSRELIAEIKARKKSSARAR